MPILDFSWKIVNAIASVRSSQAYRPSTMFVNFAGEQNVVLLQVVLLNAKQLNNCIQHDKTTIRTVQTANG